jgi:uncharacterized delta-60 repeat protein
MSNVARRSRRFAGPVSQAVQPIIQSLERRQLLSASTLDPSYGTGGIALTDFQGSFVDAAIQSDNKVVIGGSDFDANSQQVESTVERYTTSGQLDPTFGTGGRTNILVGDFSYITSVKIDALGRITAAGKDSFNDFVLRLNSDGTLDHTFGDIDPNNPGQRLGFTIVNEDAGFVKLAIRPTGQILIAGNGGGTEVDQDGNAIEDSYVAQLTTTGDMDATFGSDGIAVFAVTSSFDVHGLGIQPNGDVIVGGDINANSPVALIALNFVGQKDTSFGTQGVAEPALNAFDGLSDLAIDAGGNIDAAIRNNDSSGNSFISVYRFVSNGQLDPNYGTGGEADLVTPSLQAQSENLTIDSSGRAVVAGGAFDNSGQGFAILARFDATGHPDSTFASGGFVTTQIGSDAADVAVTPVIQSDGKIVVAGISDTVYYLARYGDAQVTPPPPPSTPVHLDSNGNLVIPGTNGNDNFQVTAAPGGVDVIYNGVDAGVFAPTGIIIATGKNGDDVINIDPSVTIAASINGGAGNDSLTGGSGNDSINGADGNDTISGGAGNDSLAAGAGDDNLSGGTGDDTIVAGNGVDIIDGGDGNNSIKGGQGADVITAGNGNNIITGATDNDSITVGDGNNSINGGAGNDSITAGNGANTINGGGGDDVIVSGVGSSSIDGGAGNDSITVTGGTTTISGGAGDDTIIGGSGADSIDGGAGNDIIVGGLGNDTITGGADRDIIIGGAGADQLTGGGDDDILVGSTTTYDSNLTALNSIKAEWTSGNTYAQRVANIRNGTGSANRQNGAFFLTTGTVFNDSASDTLTGSAGSDLFYFSSGNDHVTDLGKTETEVNV